MGVLKRGGTATRILVDQFPGHYRLWRYMFNLKLAEEEICLFCLEDEEAAKHILLECDGLVRLRFLTFRGTHPTVNSYTSGRLSKMPIKKVRAG